MIGTGGTTFDKIVFLNASGSNFEMDNFSILATPPDQIPGTIIQGGVQAIPEPASLVVWGLALVGLAFAVSRRLSPSRRLAVQL